jgi:hypothetical protein
VAAGDNEAVARALVLALLAAAVVKTLKNGVVWTLKILDKFHINL